MKIKVGEKVYLQKYEIAYFVHELNEIPSSIFNEIFGDGQYFYMNGRMTDGLRFDYCFKNPESVAWLMQQQWVADYDEYIRVPYKSLLTLTKQLETKLHSDIDKFNSRDDIYRAEHIEEAEEKFGQTRHKIESLEELLAARRGDIKYVYPKGYHGKKIHPFFAKIFSRLSGRCAHR